jgi:SagB-type dehydrogenase family enzyme
VTEDPLGGLAAVGRAGFLALEGTRTWRGTHAGRRFYILLVPIDRRGFLRFTAGAATWWVARTGAAEPPVETALGIHRATRNTRFGAVGTRVRALRSALRPWKPYPGRPRLPLPEPSWGAGRALFAATPADGDGDEPLSLAELSGLLLLANGVTDRSGAKALRAAPSAGALYAGEVYVLIDRVEGSEPGLYYYGVRGHALVPVRPEARMPEIASALEHPHLAEGATAAVLLTNVFARYRVRYANRGYRYALIDSGHIGENLRLAAREHGIAERALRRWEDDRLNALLEVDGREEAVCALHLLGRRRAAAEASESRALRERGVSGAAASLSAPTERYHEATKLVASDAGAGPPAAAAPSAPTPTVVGPAPSMPTHAAIRVRRSARSFAPESIARDALLRILAFAHGAPRFAGGSDLALHVVAHRVAGLDAGAYLLDREAHRLTPRHTGALADPLVRACLGQEKSGEAAVAVIAVANLEAATAREGPRSYRDLLLDAGAMAQRLYLGAEAHGLAARNLAAYYDDALDALLGLDGRRQAAVHLTALGPGD